MTIIFDIKAIAALTLLSRGVSACLYADFLKNQADFLEDIEKIARWIEKEVADCENIISIEELDGYDLENDVDFS